jgi:hypothetical protein
VDRCSDKQAEQCENENNEVQHFPHVEVANNFVSTKRHRSPLLLNHCMIGSLIGSEVRRCDHSDFDAELIAALFHSSVPLLSIPALSNPHFCLSVHPFDASHAMSLASPIAATRPPDTEREREEQQQQPSQEQQQQSQPSQAAQHQSQHASNSGGESAPTISGATSVASPPGAEQSPAPIAVSSNTPPTSAAPPSSLVFPRDSPAELFHVFRNQVAGHAPLLWHRGTMSVKTSGRAGKLHEWLLLTCGYSCVIPIELYVAQLQASATYRVCFLRSPHSQ